MPQPEKTYVKICIELYEGEPFAGDHDVYPYGTENMWAVPIAEYYQLDNIPFCAGLLAWNDIVRCEINEDGLRVVKEVICASHNSTVHLIPSDPSKAQEIRALIVENGAESEYNDHNNVIAINVPQAVYYPDFQQFLYEGFHAEQWDFAQSCISHWHRLQLDDEKTRATPPTDSSPPQPEPTDSPTHPQP